MYLAAFAVTLVLIIAIVLYIQSEIELRKKSKEEISEQIYYFTFTEEQRVRIKKIINQYYHPEACDICNRFVGLHGTTILEPPFKNCTGRKDYEAMKEARESNNQMFEEIEKIINE